MSLTNRERYEGDEECPSEAGSLGSLYADHEIDEDLVIGPVEIWKPKVALIFGTKTTPKEVKPIEKVIQPYTCEMCKIGNIKHYSCDLCEKQSLARVAIIGHLRKHSRPKNICKLCNKEFNYASNLKRHMGTHKYRHKNKKPYKCEHCAKSFARKDHLQAHSRLHTGEKPYMCNICSKEFAQQTSLNNHRLKHKGIKPHCCEFCLERFRQISNLNRHLEAKHSDEKSDIQSPKEKGVKIRKFRRKIMKSKTLF